jgi:hypothetical protein
MLGYWMLIEWTLRRGILNQNSESQEILEVKPEFLVNPNCQHQESSNWNPELDTFKRRNKHTH